MEKAVFIITVIFLMTQLFTHIYLTTWEKDGDKKTGWQRVGWHVLITLSFPVYLMHFSSVLVKKKELSRDFYISLGVFLVGYLFIIFALADFSVLKISVRQLIDVFLVYCIWFIIAYGLGGIIQGARNGTLFMD